MPTLAEQTAMRLAELSLASDDGTYLGNEDELLARFRISRPTLRQAARIAVNDRLIVVKRGSGGGFFAARPDAGDAVRMLGRYLRLRGASLSDIMEAEAPVSELAAKRAAECRDGKLRESLARFIERDDIVEAPQSMIRAEAELARLLGAMSGNAAIEQIMAIGFSFGLDEQGIQLFADPADRVRVRELQCELGRAVLAGDGEVARLMMHRRLALIGDWVRQQTS